MPLFAGPGVSPNLRGLTSNIVSLQAGQVQLIQPAGWYQLKPGKYTSVQQFDPITGIWRTIGGGSTAAPNEYFYSDGQNYRLANQTGCAVGALITNAGTGYTSPPVVTASAGGSLWRAIVGGAINTSVTVVNGGTGYTYPPIVQFPAPPAGGIQASGYCTLSAGAVSSVTITDQGAGYATPPAPVFVNDPREGQNGVSFGINASAVTTLTGAGTITGLVCIDHGLPQTTLPTLAFAGGGGSAAAATTIMCWSITSYAVSTTTAGSGYVSPVVISGYGGFPATAPAYTNITTQSQLVKGRSASILGALITGALTATGQTVFDGGVYPGAPTMYVQSANVPGAGAVAGVFLAPNMGGQNNDVSYLSPI